MDEPVEKDKYVIGDLLWAKIGNHPFWPCMVSYDPLDGTYYKTKKVKNGECRIYHVQYFGKQIQRGWTSAGMIFPFEGEMKYFAARRELQNKAAVASAKKKVHRKYGVPFSVHEAWVVAIHEAETALPLEIQERYESFVFKYDRNLKKSDLANGALARKNRKEANKPKKARKPYDVEENLCKICEKGNVDLHCTGDCMKHYHKECLGLINTPENFKCINCEHGKPFCFVCKTGNDSPVKCTKCSNCYHRDCLKKFPCADIQKNVCPFHTCLTCHMENPRNVSPKGPFIYCVRCPTVFHATIRCVPVGSVKLTPSLMICPDHFLGRKNRVSPQSINNLSYCSLCTEGGELICCESCPNSYHAVCIDNEVPVGDYFCDDCSNRHYLYAGMIVWAKTGQFRWWPAQVVDVNDLPINVRNMEHYEGEFAIQYFGTDEYYWTHRGRVLLYEEQHKEFPKINSTQCKLDTYYKGLEEASEAYDRYLDEKEKQNSNGKPDHYKPIKVNRVIPPASAKCTEIKAHIACYCNPNKPYPCSSTQACINRSVFVECLPDLCPAGTQCHNQKFQKREYAAVAIIKTQNRGWGLEALKLIPKGTFVIEYVGEIITHEEYRRRAEEMREKNIKNYYFLYLDAQRMIDAGPRGNMSRFINHSCAPNCEMRKWVVCRDNRIGIFAISNIHPGEELTFNYHSDSIQFEQRCNCGAENCQGYIGRSAQKPQRKKLKTK